MGVALVAPYDVYIQECLLGYQTKLHASWRYDVIHQYDYDIIRITNDDVINNKGYIPVKFFIGCIKYPLLIPDTNKLINNKQLKLFIMYMYIYYGMCICVYGVYM